MASGKVGMDYQPLRAAEARMPVEDQCRVRDRATIMSRHIFASRGDAFADAQVGALAACSLWAWRVALVLI